MREAEFLDQVYRLLAEPVIGLDRLQKLHLIRDICDEAEAAPSGGQSVTCRVVPTMSGRRPTDEAGHPGLGSSENVGMVLSEEGDGGDGQRPPNRTYVLFTLGGLEAFSPDERAAIALDVSVSMSGPDGSLATAPVPGWLRRPIRPMRFELDESGDATLVQVSLAEPIRQPLVLVLEPDEFLPGGAWQWDDLDPLIRQMSTDGDDPFTFGHLFMQVIRVQLRVTHHGVPIASTEASIDLFDGRRSGSLYRRVIERLVVPDAERQAKIAGRPETDLTFHPWFPVLSIGTEKAALYTRALIANVVEKKHYLTDSRWLLRVGHYLEFLTCLGIIEAVRDDVGDLLTPAERHAFETSPTFTEFRRRISPAWRDVWRLREITFSVLGAPQAGPVSILNLLQKLATTEAFLETHHADLKHAIELAGPNLDHAQETWHRVFRDAERAVMRKTPLAFPELAHVGPQVREFLLWHREGKFEAPGLKWMPKPLSSVFGDRDGLYASACNAYRASMNEVARWAKQHHLMDYTGDVCIPPEVSLLNACLMGQRSTTERLQRQDGYAGAIDDLVELPDEMVPADEIAALLAEVPIFAPLSGDERAQLARTARELRLGALDRLIVEGQAGGSLFIVADGRLEVLDRQADGRDVVVDVLRRGDVVGEISLLTGAPRSATVRVVDEAVAFEVGTSDFEPIIRARPGLVEELGMMMERRLEQSRRLGRAYAGAAVPSNITQRIRRFLLGGADERGVPPPA